MPKHGIFVPATKVSALSDITPLSPTQQMGVLPTQHQPKYRSRSPLQTPVRNKSSLSHLGKLQIASPLCATASSIPSPVTTPVNLAMETATEFPLAVTERSPVSPESKKDVRYEIRIRALEDAIAQHIHEKEHYKLQLDAFQKRIEPTELALAQIKEDLARKNALTSELKQATVETLEMLEGAQKKHKLETQALRQRIGQLEVERDDLHTAGLDAISAYESTIADLMRTHALEQERLQNDLCRYRKEWQDTKDENQRLLAEGEAHALRTEELASITKQQHKAELELSQLRSDLVELEQLRSKMAESDDENSTLRKSQEEEAVGGAELVRIEMQNMRLSESQRQLEGECSRLMDEVRKSEQQINELKQSAKEAMETRTAEDRARRRETSTLIRDISRLESLIESKLFKEADLLDSLQMERIQNHRLRAELLDFRRPRGGTGSDRWTVALSKCRSSMTPTLTSTTTTMSEEEEEDEEPYCEICDQMGHNSMSCAAVPNHRQWCPMGTGANLLKSCV